MADGTRLGVLLLQLGTPAAPTPAALRTYLREFLSDRRVIDLPRAVWLPILLGIVLRTRPRASALLYQ
jgi:ferrochelatase